MDNPAFQNDNGITKPPKKQLVRTNSVLTPTSKSWHLTQMPRSKLCRCNSVLVTKNCCPEEADNNIDGSASLDYPFFANKSPSKHILSENSLWTKEFWSESYNRLHDSSPVFQKFPPSKSGVATIYDPQFLSSKFGYSGMHHSVGNKEMKKEWWPGGFTWRQSASTSQKAAAIFCALVLTLLASGNIVYILKTVEKPVESPSKSNWVDVVLISGEFRITNEPYRPALVNHTSDDFQHLSGVISHQLDSLFSLSVISEPYHSTAVSELLPGLMVRCQIVLRATSQLTASKVGLAFIGGLRNQHGHVWLGNFSVDIQSIGFQATTDAVSWTSWSEWGSCQHTLEFGDVQIRTRNCTLRSGLYLHSTLPCLLVPHSHGNVETSPCLALQDPLIAAETNLDLPRVVNVTDHSQRVEKEVKITRENCKTNKVNTTDHSQTVESDDKSSKTAQVNITDGPKRLDGDIKITRVNCHTNKSAVATNVNISTTTEQPIKNISACACAENQVCVALQDQEAPQCLPVLDATDPTGCGGHCKINTQLCHNIKDNAFRCVDDSKCLEDEWQCGNQLCIPQSKRCDGHFNCYDHTDEHDCDCNLTSHFQCGNRMSCLPLTKRCDAVVDCWDATDELNCTIHCVGAEQFTCNDSQCIPNHRFCDGFPDCKDHSDEPFGCGGDCKTHEWRCKNSRCVSQSSQCDGEDDCGDGSDEVNCPTVSPE